MTDQLPQEKKPSTPEDKLQNSANPEDTALQDHQLYLACSLAAGATLQRRAHRPNFLAIPPAGPGLPGPSTDGQSPVLPPPTPSVVDVVEDATSSACAGIPETWQSPPVCRQSGQGAEGTKTTPPSGPVHTKASHATQTESSSS